MQRQHKKSVFDLFFASTAATDWPSSSTTLLSQLVAMSVSVALSLEIEETWFYDTRTRYGSLSSRQLWDTSKKASIVRPVTYFDVPGREAVRLLSFFCKSHRSIMALSAIYDPSIGELFNESFRTSTWNCEDLQIWEMEWSAAIGEGVRIKNCTFLISIPWQPAQPPRRERNWFHRLQRYREMHRLSA